MKTTQNSIFLALILICTSCDYLVHQSGIVVDNATGVPLDSAVVIFQHEKLITNSSGEYEFVHRYKERKQTIEVNKNGYKPMYLEINVSGQKFSYSVLRGTEYTNLNSPKSIHGDPNIIAYKEIHWTTSIGFEVIKTDSLKIKLERK